MDLCLSPRWFHGSHSLSHLNPMAQHTGINLAISNEKRSESSTAFFLQSMSLPHLFMAIAMENPPIFNGKTHYKWPFSIAMLVYQRVLFELSIEFLWVCSYPPRAETKRIIPMLSAFFLQSMSLPHLFIPSGKLT